MPRLPSTPSMQDIHHLLTNSLENRGSQFETSWTPTEGLTNYSLLVEANPRGGDAEWKMFAGPPENAKLLWTYLSCDVLLVYNLVSSSCGDGPNSLGAGGSLSSGFGRKTSKTYYRLDVVQTQDDMSPIRTTLGGGDLAIVRASSALTGDLAHVQTPTLLQSILMAKMTGRLVVDSTKGEAEVYFLDGVPIHALTTDNTIGEESIFELLTWKEGNFRFEPKVQADARTVHTNLDSLLLQGMQLIDNATYLRNSGLRPEARLVRKYPDLSEKDFERLVSGGAPWPLGLQKSFYQSLNENETVQQFLERIRMPRSQWIPLMCNMLHCNLFEVKHARTGKMNVRPPLDPKTIDKRAIQNVMMSLRSPETGMFSYPAFLYFLEQEYFRAYRSASPISVIVFQMRIYSPKMDPVREPLPVMAIGEAVRRISRVKRHVDLLANYEAYDYALLLPNTKTGGAQIFVNRVVKALLGEPLIPGLVDSSNLSVAFGIASIPEDFLDLSLLLAGAEMAKNMALHSDSPVVLYRDIK